MPQRFFLAICFFISATALWGQSLSLKVKSEAQGEQRIIDSIGFQQEFSDYSSLKKETDQLKKKIVKAGYIDCTLLSIKKLTKKTILAKFKLGQKIKSVTVFYDKNSLSTEWITSLTDRYTDTTFTIPFSRIEEDLSFLGQKNAQNGRPFSTVQLKKIKRQHHSLQAKLQIVQSKTRTIDSIVIKGYENFPRSYLKNFLGLKVKTPFNKEKIDRKLRRLKNLRFAQSTRPPEVLFKESSTSIYLYLEKHNSNRFDGFLGFSTDEESGEFSLNGYVNLQLNNNLNFGEALSIQYRNTGTQQERIQANLNIPFLFDTPFGLELGLDIFRRDSTFSTADQLAKTTYQINPALEVSAGYRGSSSTANENSITVGQINEDFQANYLSSGFNFKIINTYQAINPVKTNLNAEVNFGERRRQNATDAQYRLFFDGFHIFRLNRRNRLFIQNQSAYLNSDTYLTNELFRFGGINSLRGFGENSLVSSLHSAFQTEYRYLLSRNSYIHSIVDFAYTENAQLENTDRLFSFGIGFGLKTKAGLLKINIANGKNDGQQLKFINTKVHLSLTSIF